MTQKRLFVGGLFPQVLESDLKDRFSKFGSINGVEIKIRKDEEGSPIKTFAYIDMETSESDIKKCFTTYNRTKWKGSELKLQVAKENFVSRLEKERTIVEDEQYEVHDDANVVENRLNDIAGIHNFQMRGAKPGTAVPGEKNWIVGKYGRVLPVVHLKKKGIRNLVKVDPSKLTHNVKRIIPEEESATVQSDNLTWQMDETDNEVTRKRKGVFPDWKPKPKPKRKITEKDEEKKSDSENEQDSNDREKRRKRSQDHSDSDMEVVPVSRPLQSNNTPPALSNKTMDLSRFDSDSEPETSSKVPTPNKITKGKKKGLKTEIINSSNHSDSSIKQKGLDSLQTKCSQKQGKLSLTNKTKLKEFKGTSVLNANKNIKESIVSGKKTLKGFKGTSLLTEIKSPKANMNGSVSHTNEMVLDSKSDDEEDSDNEDGKVESEDDGSVTSADTDEIASRLKQKQITSSTLNKTQATSTLQIQSKKMGMLSVTDEFSSGFEMNIDDDSDNSKIDDDGDDEESDFETLVKREVEKRKSLPNFTDNFNKNQASRTDSSTSIQVIASKKLMNKRTSKTYCSDSSDSEDEDKIAESKQSSSDSDSSDMSDNEEGVAKVQERKQNISDSDSSDMSDNEEEQNKVAECKQSSSDSDSSDMSDNEEKEDKVEVSKQSSSDSSDMSDNEEEEDKVEVSKHSSSDSDSSDKSDNEEEEDKVAESKQSSSDSNSSDMSDNEEEDNKVAERKQSSSDSDSSDMSDNEEGVAKVEESKQSSSDSSDMSDNEEKKNRAITILKNNDEIEDDDSDDDESDDDDENDDEDDGISSDNHSDSSGSDSDFESLVAKEMEKISTPFEKKKVIPADKEINLEKSKIAIPVCDNQSSDNSESESSDSHDVDNEKVSESTNKTVNISNVTKSNISNESGSSDTSDGESGDTSDGEEESVSSKKAVKLAGIHKSDSSDSSDSESSNTTDREEPVKSKIVKTAKCNKSEIIDTSESSDNTDSDSDVSENESDKSLNTNKNHVTGKTPKNIAQSDNSKIKIPSPISNATAKVTTESATENKAAKKVSKHEQKNEVLSLKTQLNESNTKPRKVVSKEDAEKSKDVDKKRQEAVKQRQQENLAQKSAVQKALSNLDKSATPNKKIVFDSDSESDDVTMATAIDEASSDSESSADDEAGKQIPKKDIQKKAATLFDSSSNDDSDDDDDDEADSRFDIRPQYEGASGKKLMKLQARFGNDERFKMDKRFVESGSESESESVVVEEEDEKTRSLKILQGIVGDKAIAHTGKEEKAKRKFKDVSNLMYDPSKDNHGQFEVKSQPKPEAKEKRKSKKTEEVAVEENTQQADLPEVSKEKFYEISDSIKSVFANKAKEDEQSQSGQTFSLLAAFGRHGDVEEDKEPMEDYETSDIPSVLRSNQLSLDNRFKVIDDNSDGGSDNDDEVNLSDDPEHSEEKMDTTEMPTSASKTTNTPSTFFFLDNDARLKEGEKFYRTEDMDIVRERWSKTRHDLIENYKTKHKNFRRKLRTGQQTNKGRQTPHSRPNHYSKRGGRR